MLAEASTMVLPKLPGAYYSLQLIRTQYGLNYLKDNTLDNKLTLLQYLLNKIQHTNEKKKEKGCL